MFVKMGRFTLPCRLRKSAIFLWMVTLSLTVMFLMIGLAVKIRDIIRNRIEISDASYQQCDIFFMIFNQPQSQFKINGSEGIYSSVENDEDLSAIVLDSRFLCNVESVSRHHPENVVCILLHLPSYHTTLRKLAAKLFSLNKHKKLDKKNLGKGREENVDTLNNVRILPLNLDQIFEWGPLHDWWREDLRYTLSVWKYAHLSEVARLGFLWKYGGLYLDQDILVVNNLLHDRETNIDGSSKIENVKNTITRKLGDNFIAFQSLNISHLLPNDPTVGEVQDLYVEDMDPTTAQGLGEEGIGTSVMRFKRSRHPFVSKWMYSIPSNYDEDARDSIGSALATKLIIPFCQGDIPKSKIDASKLLNKFCDYNLHILEAKAFYPLHWKKRECLYKSAKTKGGKMSSCLFDEDAMRNKTTFAVHTWYTLLRRMGQANNDIPAESPYAKLSKAHCPNIYHTHMTKLK